MDQWEDLIAITSPDLWTPNAYYEATRLFISAKPIIAQRFLRDYLLWAVREDIKKTKKLNVHFYKALKRALFKPAAFFKAILFPLTSSGTCTLREAQIVGSVIARISVPVLHSAAALYHLSDIAANQMFVSAESGGAANIFIRILLEKKYALPYKVIDSLVFHFLRFRSVKVDSTTTKESGMGSRSAAVAGVEGKLPVLWHQCLLVFAQRYRNEITEDQREALLDLLADRWHHAISPVVERELLEGRERGTLVPTAETFDKDDTLMEM